MRVLKYLRGLFRAAIGWVEKEESGRTLLLPREQGAEARPETDPEKGQAMTGQWINGQDL